MWDDTVLPATQHTGERAPPPVLFPQSARPILCLIRRCMLALKKLFHANMFLGLNSVFCVT